MFDRALSAKFLAFFFCLKHLLYFWEWYPCPRVLRAQCAKPAIDIAGVHPGQGQTYLATYAVVVVVCLRCHTRG